MTTRERKATGKDCSTGRQNRLLPLIEHMQTRRFFRLLAARLSSTNKEKGRRGSAASSVCLSPLLITRRCERSSCGEKKNADLKKS